MFSFFEKILKSLTKNQKGSVLAEYALLIVIVVVGAIAILYQLRDAIIELIQRIIDGIL